MKFSISSGELVNGLSGVIGAIPAKATLPILEFVKIETENNKLKLSATNLEVSIIKYIGAEIETEGAVCMPARRLLEILRQLPDIPLSFDISEKSEIKFKTDRGNYKLIGEKAEDYPDVPSLEGQTIKTNTEILKDAIKKTSFAVSSDELRPAMMGVFFQLGTEETTMAATDGHRLVRLSRKDLVSATPVEFIVPEKALNLALKSLQEEECEILVADTHVLFNGGNTIVVSSLINEQYPNYESVIPRENDKTMKINREQMLSTVRRVAIFSSSTTRQVRLTLSEGELVISAEDIDMNSEAKESNACEYEDEPLEIGFNAKYLADVLSNIEDPEVTFEFSTPNRAGIVRPSQQDDDEDMLMLVMPVMLNSYA
ncbi:MAG: DNA polymerase III subunit beta [Balneolales bacterium]